MVVLILIGQTKDCDYYRAFYSTFLTINIMSQEVVAAIAEFAFVTSEYPLILSIENHCRRHPHLMQHMANTFRTYFGDKLLSQPLEDYPVS